MGRLGCERAKRAMCRGPDSSCHRAMLATSGNSSQPSLAGRHRQQQQHHHPDLLERATEQLSGHLMSVPEPEAGGSRVESSVTRFNKQQEQQVRGSMSAIELMTTKANNLCLAKRELVRSITMRAIRSQPNFQTEQGRHKSTVNALCSKPQTTKTNSNVLLPQLMLPLVLMILVAVATVACVTTVPSTASRQTVAQLGGNTESVNRVPDSRIEELSRRDKGGQIKRPKWPDEEVVQEQAIVKSRHTAARGQGVSHTWRHQRKRRHHIHPSGHQVQRRDRRLSCARRADRGGHHHLLRASENGALKSDSGVVMGHGQAIKDSIKSFERGGENELHLRYIEVESLPDDDELLLLSDKERLEKINGHDYRESRNEPYKLSRSRPLLKPPPPPTHLNLTLKDAAHYHNGLQSSKSRRSTMTRGDHKIVKIVEVADLFGAGSTPFSRPETPSPTTNQTVTPTIKLNNDIITNNGNTIIHHETQSAASSREEGGESSRESVLVSESESGSFRDVQDSVSSNNDENGNESDDEDGGEGSDDATADDDSSSSDNSTFSTSTGPKACAELENLMSNRPTGSLAISFGFFYSIIFILGLAGNVITMYVLVCKGKKRTAQDILIANLACGDIMICVFAVPVTPKYIILDGRWTMGPILCKAVSFAMSTSVYMSTYSLICIGYIRYQLIVHPWDTPMSKRNALWTCLGTWIFAILVTLPYMLNVHLAPEECEIQFCDEVWEGPFRPIFSALTTVFQFAIPLGSVIFFNWKIKNTLDSRRQELSGSGPGGVQSDKTVAHSNNNIIDSNSNRLAAPGLKRKLHNSVDHLNLFSSAAQNGAHDTPERGGATAQRQQLLARAPDVLAIKEQRLRDRDKRTRKANKRLLFVVVVFAHSWLGLNIFNLLQDITDFMTDWPYITKVFVVVHIIACSSVIWNPLLYAWMNETYQQDLRCALPRFVAARFSSLLIEPSTTSGHRSTVADGPGHHHTLPGQQHLHPQQQHSDQRQIVSAQFQGKQQDRVAAAKEATAPIDCTNIRKGSHELFALVANASDDECHQDNGQMAVARGAKAQQVDDCTLDHVDCEQQHQVDTFTIELEPACVGHGAGECCNSLDSIGHLYDCATSGRKSGQSSESVASDELLDACFCRHVEVHEDDDEDDENGCGGPAGSCNGCQNGPLQPCGASTTTNGNESTACNNNLASGTCHHRHREPDCRRGEQSGDPNGSAPVQFVNEYGATESTARLRHQNSIKASIATSQSGNNNNNNNQGSHQQQSHRRRSQRRTSCSSSIMGENLQIVV